MKKIGIVGGVGWPSTLEYYRIICTKANTHFKNLGVDPPYPTPPIAIESLVMHDVRKVRPKPGDGEEAWEIYDAIFRQAFECLQTTGCDFGLIASNTPHARLHSIRKELVLPIVSILEEAVRVTSSIGADKALVLGTDVTMRSGDYSELLKANGVKPNSPLSDAEIGELQHVIDVEFYQGGSETGHAKLIEICNKQVAYPDSTAVLLACTELPLAFPRHGDDPYFQADGYHFVNTTAAHAQAALLKSLGFSEETVFQEALLMDGTAKHDAWSAGHSYERYMGRWSREIAIKFLDWLEAPQNADWVDIGCGTGALTQTILERCSPKSVTGVEPSEGFVSHARESISDAKVYFEIASAEELPFEAASFDVSTSALALNFVPDKIKALKEMQRVTRKGGQLSFYIWDYPGGGMGFIDEFWKAAAELDPKAEDLDEGKRFPFCTSEGLSSICEESGIGAISINAIAIDTVFSTFKEFWQPFTLGTGPAPGYYMSLEEAQRNELQKILTRNVGPTEPIILKAKAWAVKTIIS